MAAALSPLSSGGQVPLNKAVWAAAQVAEASAEADSETIEALEDEVSRITAQLADEQAVYQIDARRLHSLLRNAEATAAAHSAAVTDAAGRMSRRLAALEKVYVMAAARWNHEGGPPCIREALEACDV